ncbi:hypothetical protein TMEC54S_01842 [Thauera mechernichensis]
MAFSRPHAGCGSWRFEWVMQVLENIMLGMLGLVPVPKVDLRNATVFKPGAKCLIIAPHPDDEVIGCYYLLRNSQFSHLVFDVAIVTDDEGLPGLADRRFAETISATEGLNIRQVYRWGFVDGKVIQQAALLKDKLRSSAGLYDYIFSPAPNDTTADHSVVASVALEVVERSKLIWYRSTAFTFKLAHADFIAIGDQDEKALAIRRYVSQREIAFKRTLAFERWESAEHLSNVNSGAEAYIFADLNHLAQVPIDTLSLRSVFAVWSWR